MQNLKIRSKFLSTPRRVRGDFVRALCVLGALGVHFPSITYAQLGDLAPRNTQWNGLSKLVTVIQNEGIALHIAEGAVDVGDLKAQDALLIIGPSGPIEIDAIRSLLQAGARVAVLDDSGSSGPLLDAYGMSRSSVANLDAPRIRGDAALPLARPSAPHVLVEGVKWVATNRPTVLSHAVLSPLLGFNSSAPLGFAGIVSPGRFVALGDSSLFINNMMSFTGNERFAKNLVRYLATGRGGKLVLVTGPVAIEGAYGTKGLNKPLGNLRKALARFSTGFPSAIVEFLMCLTGLALAYMALRSLPSRSPYQVPVATTPREHNGNLGQTLSATLRARLPRGTQQTEKLIAEAMRLCESSEASSSIELDRLLSRAESPLQPR